jgi:predicted acylesterase/phospholipase RssA
MKKSIHKYFITNRRQQYPILKFSNKPSVLVLSGGAIKGIAHIGVISALEQLNLLDNISTIVGSSIGALVGALIVLGYTPKELEHFSFKFEFERLKKLNFDNFIDKYGLDNGERIDTVIKTLIKQKVNNEEITLKELYDKTKKTFIATASCVEDGKTYYLHHQNEPDLQLYLALKMTTCIPFLYIPIKYKNKHFVDGACTNNYPIELFKDKMHDVIGVYICSGKSHHKISSIEDYAFRLITAMVNNGEKIAEQYKDNTILVPISDINITTFDLSIKKKKEIFRSGFESCMNRLSISI